MKIKTKETLELTIHDALANLSAIADMQIDINEPIGIVKKNKIVIQNEEFNYQTVDWFIPENAEELIENVKETYRVLLEYLKQIYTKDFIDWDDSKCRKGFQAIMVMASDAASKIDKYIELLPKQPNLDKIADSIEVKELKEFYLSKIAKKFQEALEGDEPWQDEWQNNEKSLLLDVEKSGLKDFEALKKDEEYELFYLVDDDEKSFFDPDLIRNIKLFCTYDEDELKNIEHDPLLKIRVFLDKDYQMSANQILETSHEAIDNYFMLRAQKDENSDLVSLINEALFSLMLASNPKNLITHSFFKNSIEYFHDFLSFIRVIISSDEYQKMIAYSIEDKKSRCIANLIHTLCENLFLRTGSIKQEMLGFIYMLIRKGDEKRKYKYPNKASFWSEIEQNEESIRVILEAYPSGPLMKILDVIRLEENIEFDPIMQDNVSHRAFEIDHNKNNLKIIRCPSPTRQHIITNAQVNEEFLGFLRSLKEDERYLYINFQDKESYKETARCQVIEVLQKRTDFKNNFKIISLDKKSDFYHQSGIYINLNNPEKFFEEFKKEILSKNGLLALKEITTFIDEAFKIIHKLFFINKNVFTRKNRLDFINIFYNFLILKLIEIYNPNILSFSCKDAIDIGALQNMSFYAFLKLIKSECFDKETQDYIKWLIFEPALLIRERAINSTNLTRELSALAAIDISMLTHKNQMLKALSVLYDPSFIKSIKVINH